MAAWIIGYTDELGRRHTVNGCRDKSVTEQIARRLEDEVELRRHGIQSTKTQQIEKNQRTPIKKILADYIEHCKHVGHASKHVYEKERNLNRLIDDIRAKRISDIDRNSVERHLRNLKQQDYSARTVNIARGHAVAFINWCIERSIVAANPLSSIAKLNEDKDRRHVRRALTTDEAERLLDVAGQQDRLNGKRFASRRAIYLTAMLTGLRRNELRQITWGDVDLDNGILRLDAMVSKAGRTDLLPLHVDVVETLKSIKPSKSRKSDRVFKTMPTSRTVNDDFLRAKIEKEDDEGRVVDLHALRTTLGTNLAKAGVTPQLAQKLMRHADVKTTMKHYTDLRIADAARALEKLPGVGGTAREASKQAG